MWTDKTDDNADTWEAAIRHFNKVSVSSYFLMEIDKGCLQSSVFDDSIFGEYIGSLVLNAAGVWEPTVKTNVSQNRCRVLGKSPWWDLSCDDDLWLHEQATMNRAQNSFVDEQLAQVQSAHDELRCYFADHKTMQIRPATTYDLSAESRFCLLDLRDAANGELEAVRQHIRNMKPYMLTAQNNDDSPNDDSLRALCEQQANQGGYFLLTLRSYPKEHDSTWDTSLFFSPICLDSSNRLLKLERISISTSIPRNELRTLQWNPPSHDSSGQGSARRWDGTFFTTWSTPLIGNLAKVDRMKAERINQELQKKLCQTLQTEAAIDLACDQDRVLREHFPQAARSHREEILPPDLEEIYEPRNLEQEEDEDDETETARCQSGKSGSSSDNTVTWDIRSQQSWLVRYGTQEQGEKLYGLFSKRYVVPLPPRPGMLPRCLRFNQCIGVDLVDLEVRDGTSAKALYVDKLHLEDSDERVLIVWVKPYGWPKIIVHDQGPEFMGSDFQNLAGAAGVLTMPIDSQSPWQNGKQKERDSHSNINCGIWTKSVTLKVRQSLKQQWPSVVTRGTDIAIGQVFLRINACLVPACVYVEAC